MPPPIYTSPPPRLGGLEGGNTRKELIIESLEKITQGSIELGGVKRHYEWIRRRLLSNNKQPTRTWCSINGTLLSIPVVQAISKQLVGVFLHPMIPSTPTKHSVNFSQGFAPAVRNLWVSVSSETNGTILSIPFGEAPCGMLQFQSQRTESQLGSTWG